MNGVTSDFRVEKTNQSLRQLPQLLGTLDEHRFFPILPLATRSVPFVIEERRPPFLGLATSVKYYLHNCILIVKDEP